MTVPDGALSAATSISACKIRPCSRRSTSTASSSSWPPQPRARCQRPRSTAPSELPRPLPAAELGLRRRRWLTVARGPLASPDTHRSLGVFVRLRLTPQDTSFFDLLTESANNLVLGAEAVAELFEPDADRQAISIEVRRIEHAEDEVTHSILRKLERHAS